MGGRAEEEGVVSGRRSRGVAPRRERITISVGRGTAQALALVGAVGVIGVFGLGVAVGVGRQRGAGGGGGGGIGNCTGSGIGGGGGDRGGGGAVRVQVNGYGYGYGYGHDCACVCVCVEGAERGAEAGARYTGRGAEHVESVRDPAWSLSRSGWGEGVRGGACGSAAAREGSRHPNGDRRTRSLVPRTDRSVRVEG